MNFGEMLSHKVHLGANAVFCPVEDFNIASLAFDPHYMVTNRLGLGNRISVTEYRDCNNAQESCEKFLCEDHHMHFT